MKESETNSETKPETKSETIPEAKAKPPSDLAPQLVKRVHELYEELGREQIRAVLAWEKKGREIREDETKAEPNSEAKPETKAENILEVKTAESESKAKVVEPNSEVEPETKTETIPEVKTAKSVPKAKAAKPRHEVRNKIIFALSIIGVLAGLVAAFIFGIERKAQPPVFKPVSNPYESAIYANGIIESDQSSGAGINIYPEVSGPITRVLVREGQQVLAGTLLFTIDDSVQRATMELAESNLKVAQDQYDKRRSSYDIDPKSISKDVLDTAKDAVIQAASALKAANELLKKYSIKAPVGGVIFAVNAATGSYVSSQGAYDSYTQGFDPLVVMGTPQEYLAVRCYVDEILVSRLPSPGHIRAQMSIRGSDVKVPLEFVRIQPYVSPKIELSNQRQEQVDLRVLPVIFRFEKKDAPVYPGQLVDVYIGQQ
jgi:HlyD family secretion protein